MPINNASIGEMGEGNQSPPSNPMPPVPLSSGDPGRKMPSRWAARPMICWPSRYNSSTDTYKATQWYMKKHIHMSKSNIYTPTHHCCLLPWAKGKEFDAAVRQRATLRVNWPLNSCGDVMIRTDSYDLVVRRCGCCCLRGDFRLAGGGHFQSKLITI